MDRERDLRLQGAEAEQAALASAPRMLPWIGLPEHEEVQSVFQQRGRRVNFARNEIIRTGSSAASILLIERGLCMVYADDGLVPTHVLGLATPGCALAMSKIFGDGGPSRMARALRAVVAWSLSPEAMREVLSARQDLGYFAARRLVAAEESQIEGLLANASFDPERRLASLLDALIRAYRGTPVPGWNLVPLLLSNEEYAAITHLARITVSRKFSRWCAAGVMQKAGRQLHVHSDLLLHLRVES